MSFASIYVLHSLPLGFRVFPIETVDGFLIIGRQAVKVKGRKVDFGVGSSSLRKLKSAVVATVVTL